MGSREMKPEMQEAEDHLKFGPFVHLQVRHLGSFTSASKEGRISIALQMLEDTSEFLQLFDGRLGALPESQAAFVLILYLMAQAVPKNAELLAALQDFCAEIQDSVIDYQAVKIPRSFDKTQREPANYLNMVKVIVKAYAQAQTTMERNHHDILNDYRSRIDALAQNLNVPEQLIKLTCEEDNWVQELKDLVSFEVSHVFVPVWNPQNTGRPVAVKYMMRYLLKGERPGRLLRVMANEDLEFLHMQGLNYKKRLVQIFVRLALRIAPVDGGRLLANILYNAWISGKPSLSKMLNRNLYTRNLWRFGIVSWREYLQVQILGIPNDDPAMKSSNQ